jgi:hypothetical protein
VTEPRDCGFCEDGNQGHVRAFFRHRVVGRGQHGAIGNFIVGNARSGKVDLYAGVQGLIFWGIMQVREFEEVAEHGVVVVGSGAPVPAASHSETASQDRSYPRSKRPIGFNSLGLNSGLAG